jgi:uncharacterized protein (TIGR02231 family)
MTFLFRLTAVICMVTLPVSAETVTAASKITSVTLYGSGAIVKRQMSLTLPAGVTDVVLPDLPQDIDLSTLQIKTPDGVELVSLTLAKDRLPPLEDTPDPAVQAARAEVDRLEAALRQSAAAVEAIRLKAAAANETLAALRGIAQTGHGDQTVDDLRALSQMIGQEALVALQAAHQAALDAAAAEMARADDLKALEFAKAALTALTPGQKGRSALLMSLNSEGGPAVLEMTNFASGGWRPYYELRLTTGASPSLTIDRGATVTQESGEDWVGVELILTTADLDTSDSAGKLYGKRLSIANVSTEQNGAMIGDGGAAAGAAIGAMMVEPLMESVTFRFENQGLATLYRFPVPVSLRSSAEEETRLSMNSVEFTPDIYAMAVPRHYLNAFVTADFTNTSDEPLQRAATRLYLDGVLVGASGIEYVPVGGKTAVGFGPVEGLVVKRTVSDSMQGENGLITVTNNSKEMVQIDLNNLTGRDWPVRLQDRVPFSEQDDLKISYTAAPPATTESIDGERGVLEWRFDLPAGQEKQITLETRMQWPDGMELD